MYMNNSKVKGEMDNEGHVAEVFKRMRGIISKNDGTRSFEWVSDSCHDQQAPFDSNQETRISITSTQHAISDLSKGFIKLRVTAEDVRLEGIVAAEFNDEKNLCKLMLGWRDSNNAPKQLQVWVNGHSIGYNQQEAIREGFAYSTCKGADDLEKRFIHSLYEKVVAYATQICGAYFNVNDVKDGKPFKVTWDANIPFDDLLVFQAFDLFPNFAITNVEIRMKISPEGLVWALCDPHTVYDNKTLIQEEEIQFTLPQVIKFTRQFTQINNPAIIPKKFTVAAYGGTGPLPVAVIESGEVRLSCTKMTINQLKSHMAGFGICEASKNSIIETLSEGLVFPAQFLSYESFPEAAGTRGIKSQLRATLSNVTNLSVVFPKHSNDLTVFENPVYENLQLRINNKPYPDDELSTLGAEFLQLQLIASDLDGPIRCSKEFEDSFTLPKNAPDGTRYKNTLSDATRFMWNLQLERNGGGYFFDGYDSFGQNIPIELVGKPIYPDARDTYYNVDEAGTIHPPPAQVWVCKDVYLTLVPGDIKFHMNGEPEGLQEEPTMRAPTRN